MKKYFGIKWLIILFFCELVVKGTRIQTIASKPLLVETTIKFSPPMSHELFHFGPITQYYGNPSIIVEDTRYGIHNLDLSQGSCFGVPLEETYHAGEDWYRFDSNNGMMLETALMPVQTVADGVVVHRNDPLIIYPGNALIIEHILSPPLDGHDKIYSVYMHLHDVYVGEQDIVHRGQIIGNVEPQSWTGDNPDPNRPTYDSHLHWEIRYFFDGSNIYPNFPDCNNPVVIAGRGYTFPEHPDTFPANAPYVSPSLATTNRTYLPFYGDGYVAPCSPNANLIVNGGFEAGHDKWVETPPNILTYFGPTPPHTGQWGAYFGGRNSAEDTLTQKITIPANTQFALLNDYVWMQTFESHSSPFDTLNARLYHEDGSLFRQLDQISNIDEEGIWLHQQILVDNLNLVQGETLQLRFEGQTDSSILTDFFLDDVSFILGCQLLQ